MDPGRSPRSRNGNEVLADGEVGDVEFLITIEFLLDGVNGSFSS
jgi:hypothetical protein